MSVTPLTLCVDIKPFWEGPAVKRRWSNLIYRQKRADSKQEGYRLLQ